MKTENQCQYTYTDPTETDKFGRPKVLDCQYKGDERCSTCGHCKNHCPSHYSYAHGLDTSKVLNYFGFREERKKNI